MTSHRVPGGHGGLLGSRPQTLHACCVQADPWGAQMPQLELQQYSPSLQAVFPQGTPGTQVPVCGSHTLPGGQTFVPPEVWLQLVVTQLPVCGSHTLPGGHSAPIASQPPPQTCRVQAPPMGAQIPQLSLQQYSPCPQIVFPHGA